MTTFTLDTSGAIFVTAHPKEGERYGYRWSDLPNDFVRGYVGAIFAEMHRADPDEPDIRLTLRWTRFSDLHPEALALILRDCEAWQEKYPKSGFGGGLMWAYRQSGAAPSFPPLTISLEEGKVMLRGDR